MFPNDVKDSVKLSVSDGVEYSEVTRLLESDVYDKIAMFICNELGIDINLTESFSMDANEMPAVRYTTIKTLESEMNEDVPTS